MATVGVGTPHGIWRQRRRQQQQQQHPAAAAQAAPTSGSSKQRGGSSGSEPLSPCPHATHTPPTHLCSRPHTLPQFLLYRRSSPNDNHYAHPLDAVVFYDPHTDT